MDLAERRERRERKRNGERAAEKARCSRPANFFFVGAGKVVSAATPLSNQISSLAPPATDVPRYVEEEPDTGGKISLFFVRPPCTERHV